MIPSLRSVVHFLRERNRTRLAKHRERTRTRQSEQYVGTLAVAGIMKDEVRNLDEWISHYLQLGADRIVLVDNGSTDGSFARAQRWVDKGCVDLISRPERHRQADHVWEATNAFVLGRYQWLLVADLDEFWFCPDGSKLSSKLCTPDFFDVDVIYANWMMFGSSGLKAHPQSIRTSLVHRQVGLEAHRNRKYICRTSVLRFRSNFGVHKVSGADSARTVSDNQAFHLFHYPIQSLEYFQEVKMTRGDAMSSRSDNVRDMAYFLRHDAICTQEDRTLATLVEEGRLGST